MAAIKIAYLKTPTGFMEVTGTKRGVQTARFINRKARKLFTPFCLRECVDQLKEYFEGKRELFSIKLDLQGTDFQLKVWQELQKIPYGKTITYHELAEGIGDPKAFRAVGQADAKNPIAVIIPCHRVLGNDGKLVGYAGGLERKKWLLEHEQALSQKDLFY